MTGKQIGVYLMFEEEYFKTVIRKYAKVRGMTPDQYCEWVIRNYHDVEGK